MAVTDMLPHVLLLAAVIIWGWTFIATTILVAEIGPVEIFALRLAIGLPFLGGVLLVRRVPLRVARADARPLVVGGAIRKLRAELMTLFRENGLPVTIFEYYENWKGFGMFLLRHIARQPIGSAAEARGRAKAIREEMLPLPVTISQSRRWPSLIANANTT